MSSERHRIGDVALIPRGNRWHYRFRVAGKRTQKSTREPLRNEAKAERIALEAYEAAKLRARGREPEPTLAEGVRLWITAHALRRSPSHIANMERFGRLHLGQLAELKLSKLSTAKVEEQLNAFLAEGREHSTGNQWLTYLRTVCKWGIRRGMIRAMPFDVPETRVKRKTKALLPTGRVLEWLEKVDRLTRKDPAIGLLLRLMVGIGLRPSEARHARWEWIDWDRQTYAPSMTKGGDVVPRPIPGWLFDLLRSQRMDHGWMVSTRRGSICTASRLGAIVAAACKGIGIPRLTPHRLRATYATWLSEDGATIQDIKEALEHKDINTTARYLGIDLSRVVSAQQRTAERTGLAGRRSGAPTRATQRGSAI